MGQAFYTSIGGINAAQTTINVVADNLANMNTVGFKSSSVTFSDVYYNTISSGNAPSSNSAGRNPKQIGLGVQVGSINRDFTNGTVTSTGSDTDLNIQGEGFFCVTTKEGGMYYTRAGNFDVDSDGNLVLPSGYMAVGADKLFDTKTSGVQIQIPPKIQTETVPNTDTTVGSSLKTKNFEDLNGCALVGGTFYMDITEDGVIKSYTVDATSATNLGMIQAAVQKVFDDNDLKMNAKCDETTEGKFTITPGKDTKVTNITFRSGTSNFVIESGITSIGGNTYESKVLDYKQIVTPPDDLTKAEAYKSVAIGEDGILKVTYANGDTLTVQMNENTNSTEFKYITSTGTVITGNDVIMNPNVCQTANLMLQMATFMNPQGLTAIGGNVYSVGINAGNVSYGTASMQSFGSLSSGGYESSNVDMTQQFADMIIAQRTIEANSRVFSTANNIQQTLVYMGQS